MSINYLKSILANGKDKVSTSTDIENKSVNNELISMLTDQLPLAFLENDLVFPSEVLSIINAKEDDDEDFDDEDFDDEDFDDSDFYDDEFDDDFEDDFEEEEEDAWDDSF